MRIAFTSTFDSRDVHNWSGTPFYMSKAFEQIGVNVEYVGSLKNKRPPFFKLKQIYNKYIMRQRVSPRFNTDIAKNYSLQAAEKLKNLTIDAIVSPLINPIAYLETDKPIVLWTDAVYGSLLGFYPPFNYHSASTITQGNAMTRSCLERVKLAIFCSDWAARAAIEHYGVSKEKVKVVPFGANIQSYPDANEIEHIIAKRDKSKIKLLFLAKSWERKGGDIVLKVANALHAAGHPVELTIVGYNPPNLHPVPSFVRSLGYISKNTPEGLHRIQQLLSETHFLFVPSRAEAYGIVFCEANAFAVPCLTTYVGGIGTIVKDNMNGMTFGLDASVETYCHYIVELMQDTRRYDDMCRSSYNEFITRLNWRVSAERVKELMGEVI